VLAADEEDASSASGTHLLKQRCDFRPFDASANQSGLGRRRCWTADVADVLGCHEKDDGVGRRLAGQWNTRVHPPEPGPGGADYVWSLSPELARRDGSHSKPTVRAGGFLASFSRSGTTLH
jgi:hypothetical protein